MFGNRTGHRPGPPRGRLEAIANLFGSISTIVTSLLILGSTLYLFGFFNLPWFSAKPPQAEADPVANIPNDGKGLLPADRKGMEVLANSNLGTEKQAIAFARAKQRQAVDACDEALRTLEECVGEINRFEALAGATLTNDEGKQIAGDPSFLKRFRLIQGKERPARAKAERYQQTVAEIAEPLKASLRNPKDVSVPRGEVVAEVERIQKDLQGQLDAWRKDRILLESLVAETRRSNPAPAPKTLEETIRLVTDAETAAFTKAMEEEATKAKAEMDAKLIKAKADGIRAIEQAKIDQILAEKRAEAERIRTEAFLKEAKEKAAAEATRLKVEKERARAKIADPRVKQMLGPIIAKTLFQPVRTDTGKIKNDHVGGRLERISFARLTSVGALESTDEGLAALAIVGCYQNRRPRWAFSTIPAEWSPQTRAFLQEVQALLIELGPTLVEERLLEP